MCNRLKCRASIKTEKNFPDLIVIKNYSHNHGPDAYNKNYHNLHSKPVESAVNSLPSFNGNDSNKSPASDVDFIANIFEPETNIEIKQEAIDLDDIFRS
jgi:hypothetical protein